MVSPGLGPSVVATAVQTRDRNPQTPATKSSPPTIAPATVNLSGRLLSFSIAVPTSLGLLSSPILRPLFGLLLSISASLELQSNVDKSVGQTSVLSSRLCRSSPSTVVVIMAILFKEDGLHHSLSLALIVISAIFVLMNCSNAACNATLHTQFLYSIFSCFYIGGSIAHAALINHFPYAFEALLYTIVITAVGEVFGLFGGNIFGHHRVTVISPGKTLEGYICTSVSSIIASIVFDCFLHAIAPETTFPVRGAALHFLAGLIAIAGSIGDLVESLLKRFLHVKDMGNVLPGWGGILDRIDALLFAFPTTYYYLILFRYLTSG
uniref:Phosphatidate cytidylyltransferase n=1 Tax=Spongospora subterranea TaxID=70186 RepID=A0A0H5RJW8_9EUKA|eukprot:CRZ09019.1 hypothetical protein [Spongospora subterranea]